MTPTPAAERGADAAVAQVRAYYRAVSRHDYRAAYAIWHGRQSLAAFRRGYAHLASVRMTPVPPFALEGAAGSVYVTVRVRVDAITDTGRRQHFAGSYDLRRVNDVEGASAAARRWHVIGAQLHPVPAGS